MTISYTRTFSHTDWVDNVSRVQAGGDDGFNGRFHGIEAEFDSISGVVTQVNGSLAGQSTQLTSLQQQVSALGVAISRAVSVPPVFTLAGGQNGWDLTANPGVAQKPQGVGNAFGAVAVTLPAGAQITGFRALGRITAAGTLSLDLMRQKLTGQGQVSVVNITATGQPNPFDVTKAPVNAQGFDLIDPDFSYFITAQLSGAGGADQVTLTGFQILYQAR